MSCLLLGPGCFPFPSLHPGYDVNVGCGGFCLVSHFQLSPELLLLQIKNDSFYIGSLIAFDCTGNGHLI